MSISCPQCGTSLDQDFGLATCGKCGSVSVIDIDGVAHLSAPQTEEPASVVSPGTGSIPFNVNQDVSPIDQVLDPQFPMLAAAVENPIPAFEFEANADQDFASVDEIMGRIDSEAVTPQTSLPEAPPQVKAVESAPEKGSFLDEAPDALEKSTNVAQDSAIDLSEYANQDLSRGGIRYTLIIEGIDNSDMRENLKLALSNSLFGWSPAEQLRLLRNGTLRIVELDPAKASLLVGRLRNMGIKVNWEQHVY